MKGKCIFIVYSKTPTFILRFYFLMFGWTYCNYNESNEPGYNEDQDQLKEEQEEETDEISTANSIF
jgi:hypothetical protein